MATMHQIRCILDRVEFDSQPWDIFGFEVGRRYVTHAPDGSLWVEVNHAGATIRVHPAFIRDSKEYLREHLAWLTSQPLWLEKHGEAAQAIAAIVEDGAVLEP